MAGIIGGDGPTKAIKDDGTVEKAQLVSFEITSEGLEADPQFVNPAIMKYLEELAESTLRPGLVENLFRGRRGKEK